MSAPPSDLNAIFAAALAAVDPEPAVRDQLDGVRALYHREGHGRLIVTGFGKAAFAMARAVRRGLPDLIADGCIVTKDGHRVPEVSLDPIRVREAGHPLPDERGLAATAEILGLGAVDERTLVVNLVSGGGSALLVAPAPGVTLTEKQRVTEQLLKAGATIQELNAVRKHLSRVKGGRLAAHLHPARTLSFLLSDVIGDAVDVIASGPTAPDPTTYDEAWAVLERHRLLPDVPDAVRAVLNRGRRGELPETPKPGDPVFSRVENRIVGSNRLALAAAGRRAESLGYAVRILSAELAGEAVEVGKALAAVALRARIEAGSGRDKLCLLAGGETTVTVRGAGRGGRNQELALSFAMEIAGVEGITMLSAGTDGTDGPTDAAGARVDGRTVIRAERRGLAADEYLARNDSYTFFERLGERFVTGPTGTNVMDIQVVLIG
ncbi:MAG: glycerate kinase [Syntrophales bacterium]|jgi:glycerate-2-kinase|nr:glycerate kinase [Syntrophales bacterium]MDD4338083.1 glycerate kinase [Syntrophales bacterium]HOS78121.1 glycerate kinase [Syntrophales bacterium]HQN25936.1 glycerate kinase [Syntrophales bacterium]